MSIRLDDRKFFIAFRKHSSLDVNKKYYKKRWLIRRSTKLHSVLTLTPSVLFSTPLHPFPAQNNVSFLCRAVVMAMLCLAETLLECEGFSVRYTTCVSIGIWRKLFEEVQPSTPHVTCKTYINSGMFLKSLYFNVRIEFKSGHLYYSNVRFMNYMSAKYGLCTSTLVIHYVLAHSFVLSRVWEKQFEHIRLSDLVYLCPVSRSATFSDKCRLLLWHSCPHTVQVTSLKVWPKSCDKMIVIPPLFMQNYL